MFFKVIIPTYGNCQYLDDAINSVLGQTIANDLYLIVVHDNTPYPTNALKEITKHISWNHFELYLPEQRWNGGARNAAMKYEFHQSEYTIFLDHDDLLTSNMILEELKAFAIKNSYPDVIRLPYSKHYMADDRRVTKIMKDETSIDEFLKSKRVAPWTKAVKTSKIPTFPENTVFEDVIHHLKVCDVCNTYVKFDKPVIEWRMWDGQTSKRKDAKWESSEYRFIADLMDLKVNKPDVEKRKQERIKLAQQSLYSKLGGM